MGLGFAIGNGLSRIGFDLERLRGRGPIIGCNYIYQATPEFRLPGFWPDVLVAIDVEPMKRAWELRKGYINQGTPCWDLISRNATRTHLLLNGDELMSFEDINGTYSNNSGVISCGYLAKVLNVDTVYMIGFDFFRNWPGVRHNDVYGKNIVGSKLHLCFNKLAADCPDTEFVRCGPIVDFDREFYDETLQGIRYIESWRDFWDETS